MSSAKKNVISTSEFAVLNSIHKLSSELEEQRTAEVAAISQSTGIKDNDEIIRALYTLEGKSLVRPEPFGDFTSNHWQITDNGRRALRMVSV